MKIKLGIKAFSIVSGMLLSLVAITGCNEETPAPATPSTPAAKPEMKPDAKPAAPATPPATKTEEKKK